MYIVQTILFKQQELGSHCGTRKSITTAASISGCRVPSKARVQQSHHTGMCPISNGLFLFLSTHYTQEGVTWTHRHEAFLSERDLFTRAEPVPGAREREMEDRLPGPEQWLFRSFPATKLLSLLCLPIASLFSVVFCFFKFECRVNNLGHDAFS